jgi:hypothetical protein
MSTVFIGYDESHSSQTATCKGSATLTMISGFRLRYGLFLQSDILLTSPKELNCEDAEFPTYHNYESGGFPLPDDRVSGLAQKTLTINDHFAVAFSGRGDRIFSAIHLIRKLTVDNQELTSDRYLSALRSDPELMDENLSVIILAPAGDEVGITYHGPIRDFSTVNFDMVAGGSGAQHAIDHFSQYPIEAFDVCDEDIVAQGTCMALEQFANHIIDEIDNQELAKSITECFGGGYEISAFYDGKINKVPDIVYAFAEARFDEDMYLQVEPPNFLMKTTYKDDNLLIRSLVNEVDPADGFHKRRHDRTFTIAPITRFQESTVEEGCEDVHFLGKFLCFIIKVRFGKFNSFTIPFIKKYNTFEDFVTKGFFPLPMAEHITFKYSKEFNRDIHERVVAYMKKLEDFGKTLQEE